MKKIILLSLLLFNFIITAQIKSNSPTKTALIFVNSYLKITEPGSKINRHTWINENPMLTQSFKKSYNRLMKTDIDWDPIVEGNDRPDKFELVTYDKKSNYLTFRGINWKEFLLTIKIVNLNGKWFVDGSGSINIPKNRQAKR